MITSGRIIGSGISYAVYSRQGDGVTRGHPDFIMSRSELVEFADCPAKWLAGEQADEGTPSTLWGSLVDCLLLTPEKFDDLYAVSPENYTSEKGEVKEWNWKAKVCKAWRDNQPGVTVIKHELRGAAQQAVYKILQDVDISAIILASSKQVMLTGEWSDDNNLVIPIRCLIDLVPHSNDPTLGKALCNFKTARSGDPEHWARVCDDMAYDVGAALEMDLYNAATDQFRTDYIFPCQENTPPFHVVKPMMALTVEFVSWGRSKYQRALSLYATCLKTDTWPSYSTGDRLVYGHLQFIAPDSLWTYRQKAGEGARMEDRYPANEPVKDRACEMAEVVP